VLICRIPTYLDSTVLDVVLTVKSARVNVFLHNILRKYRKTSISCCHDMNNKMKLKIILLL